MKDKEKKYKIDKFISADEKIISRLQMSKAAGISYLLLTILIFAIIIFAIYTYLIYSHGYSGSPFSVTKTDIEIMKQTKPDYLLLLFIYIPLFVGILPVFINKLGWTIRSFTREAIITDERLLIYDSYLIGEHTFTFTLRDIKEIMGKKSFFGKIFHYGEIYVGTGNQTIGLDGYKDYENVSVMLEKLVKEKKESDKIEKQQKSTV